jgi:hypothetical protein
MLKGALLGLIVWAGACLVLTQPAWASVTVTATVSGSAAIVEAAGTTEPCFASACPAQTAQIEVLPYYSTAPDCVVPVTSQGSTPILSGGASFDFTTTVPLLSGREYTVCGYVMQETSDGGYSEAVDFSRAVTVAIPPAACSPGTTHALQLTAPLDRLRPAGYRCAH